MKISVCGKGGSGKSVLVAMLAQQAQIQGYDVVVIDSDESNSGLFRMLGFEKPPAPLMELAGGKGKIKEKMSRNTILRKKEIFTKEISAPYIQRRNGLMLISIGKILQAYEGCACPMGVLSREFLNKLQLGDNEIAIVDMEAGVEHFGRGIDESIDSLLLVVEPSFESLAVAEKIRDIATGMKKNMSAVLNKIPSEKIALKLEDALRATGIKIIGTIPNDSAVFKACLEGRRVDDGKAFHMAGNILKKLLAIR